MAGIATTWSRSFLLILLLSVIALVVAGALVRQLYAVLGQRDAAQEQVAVLQADVAYWKRTASQQSLPPWANADSARFYARAFHELRRLRQYDPYRVGFYVTNNEPGRLYARFYEPEADTVMQGGRWLYEPEAGQVRDLLARAAENRLALLEARRWMR